MKTLKTISMVTMCMYIMPSTWAYHTNILGERTYEKHESISLKDYSCKKHFSSSPAMLSCRKIKKSGKLGTQHLRICRTDNKAGKWFLTQYSDAHPKMYLCEPKDWKPIQNLRVRDEEEKEDN